MEPQDWSTLPKEAVCVTINKFGRKQYHTSAARYFPMSGSWAPIGGGQTVDISMDINIPEEASAALAVNPAHEKLFQEQLQANPVQFTGLKRLDHIARSLATPH